MACGFCAAIEQFVRNGLLTADRFANFAMLGSPNETLSQRTARASIAGKHWAIVACQILGWFSTDHCAWSLTPGSTGAEIWDWTA